MVTNDVTGTALAARSGLSRRYVADLRYGRCSPTLDSMKFVAGAMSDILGRRVRLGELFDLRFDVYDD